MRSVDRATAAVAVSKLPALVTSTVAMDTAPAPLRFAPVATPAWAYRREWAAAVAAKLSPFVETLSSVPEATPHLLEVFTAALKLAVDKAQFTITAPKGAYSYNVEEAARQRGLQRQELQKRALVLLILLQAALRSWAEEPATKLRLAEFELAMSRTILGVRTLPHGCASH